MKDWNSHLLIGFGFVLGVLVMLLASPYLLTVEYVQGSPKLGGLPNEYGGVIGGVMALGAAVLVVWMEHRKAARADLELKQVLAYNLLSEFQVLHDLLAAVHVFAKNPNIQDQFIRNFGSYINLLAPNVDNLKRLPPLDHHLGMTIISTYKTVLNRTEHLITAIGSIAPGSSFISDPETNRVICEDFIRLFGRSKSLFDALEAIRTAKLPEPLF